MLKIDFTSNIVVIDGELEEDFDFDELIEELPERSPRFVLVSYYHKHDDGRVSVPLILVSFCPNGGKPHNNMLFASVKPSVVNATGATKLMDIREREELLEENIIKKFT